MPNAPMTASTAPGIPGAAPVQAAPNNGATPLSMVNANAAMQVPQTTPTVPAYTAPGSITSASLQPATPTAPVQPSPPPVYDTTNLNVPSVTTPPITETPQQQEQSSLSQQLEALTTENAGKAAFTTDQQNQVGIPALQQTQNDLGTQLKTLQDQAKQIPLIDQNAGVGRMSVAGISGQDTVNLRNNAIQSLALSAQIDATNGLLSSAQQKVTAAAAQQYGPIEAQMAALTANLKTIAADPQSTVDEKNAASAQLDAVNAQKDQIAAAKANTTAVMKVGTDAAANIANFSATPQYPTAATALKAISSAPDEASALQVAAATGLTIKASTAAPKIIGNATSGYYSVDPKTGALTTVLSGTGPRSTPTEQKNSAISQIQTQLAPGYKSTAGVPTLSPDGTMTLEAWQHLSQNSTSIGLTRADILKNFGSYLVAPDGTVSPNYGLTPVETRQVTGALGTTGTSNTGS